MAEGNDKIILFFDRYSAKSRKLHESFKIAGYDYPVVIVEDDGFLPDGVKSIYELFFEDFKMVSGSKAGPRHYNDISLEKEADKSHMTGRIITLDKEREELLYGWPVWPRIVRAVDWLDDKGTVRMTEHYNRYGIKYARTLYDKNGQKISKSYYSAEGQEMILEDCAAGSILVQKNGEKMFFHTKTDFITFYFQQKDPEHIRLFYNTLAIPFHVSLRLGKPANKDILFWDEPLGEGIPGNMQLILKGQAGRTAHVVVQDRQVYDRLVELGADSGGVHQLGFLYPFVKKHSGEMEMFVRTLKAEYVHRPEALICTNSEQIEYCREIVEGLPQIKFHIAARTIMSSKLMEMGRYENVRLWPNIQRKDLEELLENCDYFLDINRGTEIISAVRRAFLHDLLIFAFRETVHNKEYIAEEHIYPMSASEDMVVKIKVLLEDKKQFEDSLSLQHAAAMTENDNPTGILKYQMAQYLK